MSNQFTPASRLSARRAQSFQPNPLFAWARFHAARSAGSPRTCLGALIFCASAFLANSLFFGAGISVEERVMKNTSTVVANDRQFAALFMIPFLTEPSTGVVAARNLCQNRVPQSGGQAASVTGHHDRGDMLTRAESKQGTKFTIISQRQFFVFRPDRVHATAGEPVCDESEEPFTRSIFHIGAPVFIQITAETSFEFINSCGGFDCRFHNFESGFNRPGGLSWLTTPVCTPAKYLQSKTSL